MTKPLDCVGTTNGTGKHDFKEPTMTGMYVDDSHIVPMMPTRVTGPEIPWGKKEKPQTDWHARAIALEALVGKLVGALCATSTAAQSILDEAVINKHTRGAYTVDVGGQPVRGFREAYNNGYKVLAAARELGITPEGMEPGMQGEVA